MPNKPKAATDSPADAPADLIDNQLERYRSMRDFTITAEPSGDAAGTKKSKTRQPGLPFVIQKHAATNLHYDFRLGWNGVLKSWACAKGPSYVTADKRLAVQVEDHPMEYGGFEGIIPKGQYGGGTVMLWDEGTWEPQAAYPNVDEGLRTGSLKFVLHGAKLQGKWALIRMGGKYANEKKPNWLLIKEHDDFERHAGDPPITEEAPNSVITGRSIEEIAKNQDHVWNSRETASGNAWRRNDEAQAEGPAKSAPAKVVSTTGSAPRKGKQPGAELTKSLKDAPKEKLPDFLTPQLASPATTPPKDKGWLHELKLDGYRIQARKEGSRPDGKQVQLLTRTGLDWTHRMKILAAEVANLPAEDFILDGEVVVLAPDGNTSFADLQAAFQDGVKKPLHYFLFDLLHLNGHNLRGLPLRERKAILAKLLENANDSLRLSEHLEADGAAMFRAACEVHAEGIVSKRADSKYTGGRSASWLKLKCIRQQELVIGGFTLPSNGIHGVGALLLGYYKGNKLIYAGRTGTGFTQKTHKTLRDRLDQLRERITSFEKPPAEARKGAIWVKPELVAQINFATWTADNLVRQASFQGLREDKPASEVVREQVTISPTPGGAKRASHTANTAPAGKAIPEKQAKAPDHPAIRLTHPDKILDPESQLTKQQLADYYWAIAPHMLPHIAGRPLSLVRCPDGAAKPCFFQKHAKGTLPKGIESVIVPDKKTGKPEPYITLSTPTALAELAQMGVMEVHPWGSRNDDLERPDRLTIDLDPDAAIGWETLAASAVEVRSQLKSLGFESFVKTTGGKGLHVVLPIEPDYEWPIIKQFVHAFALAMEKRQPSLYLTKMSKAARAGRIFIDYIRNERGATAVAAYSPRARPGAAVSLPLAWSDLKLSERPVFRVANYEEWKPRLKRDPWKDLPSISQQLTSEILRLFKIAV